MPEFTITRQINAPVETVWEVLDDFGDIQRWNPGVTASGLTSEGSVGEGTTRSCDFAPFGRVNERITHHEENTKLGVHLYETFKLPISESHVDFNIAPKDGGTELVLDYSYTPNLMGRIMGPMARRMLERGIGGLAKSLAVESERMAAV